MPSRPGPSAREIYKFWFGDRVDTERGWGRVVLPSSEALLKIPHDDNDVPVQHFDGSFSWVNPKKLKLRQ